MRIIKGKIPCAKKVVIYGPEGIGKSTFAARFPEPVFIDTEGSTKDMDVSRFEKPSSWTMLMEQIRYVKMNPSVCRTLVIDTADWAEQMCVADLCARYGKKGIEDFGYGTGYVYAREEFGRFLNSLEEVVEAGIHVVITAHAHLKKFEQPDELGAYDRWELKLGKKTSSQTAPLLKEWADMVLFANYKTWSVAVDDKGNKRKAQGGARVMYTSHHPCWDAKNRYGLPEEMPFAYEGIRAIIEEAGSLAETGQAPAITTPEPVQKSQGTGSMGQPVTAAQTSPSQAVREPEAPAPGEGVQQAMDLSGMSVGEKEAKTAFDVDPRVPKKLRDLMLENHVLEWEIESACESKGYIPVGTPLYQYEDVNPGFTDAVLVVAWPQVLDMVKQIREKEAIPF